jgi:hypothetical protein
VGEEHYCREKNFVQAFNEHCKECHLERHKFTTDYYLGVFGNYSITVRKNEKMKYPNNHSGRMYQGTFIAVLTRGHQSKICHKQHTMVL